LSACPCFYSRSLRVVPPVFSRFFLEEVVTSLIKEEFGRTASWSSVSRLMLDSWEKQWQGEIQELYTNKERKGAQL